MRVRRVLILLVFVMGSAAVLVALLTASDLERTLNDRLAKITATLLVLGASTFIGGFGLRDVVGRRAQRRPGPDARTGEGRDG